MTRTIAARAMRLAGGGILLVALAATGYAAEPPGDLAALQGSWKLLHCEYQGTPQMTAEVMKQITAVYEQDQYFLYLLDKGRDGKTRPVVIAAVQIALDPTTQPKSITFTFQDGPLKGQKRHGIYELAGNQLKLCYGPAEKPRPTAFAAPPGSGYFLEVWARQTK